MRVGTNYENLASAIILQALEDYKNAIINLNELQVKLEEAKKNPKVTEHRKGETNGAYRVRKHRNSTNWIKKSIEFEQNNLKSCIEFFDSDWIKQITEFDCGKLLEECNAELKKQGYEVKT